jgi:putative hydrolase of the HAD superfamily
VPDPTRARAVLFDLFHTLVSLEVSQAPGPSISELLGVDKETWWRVWVDDSGGYLLGRTDLKCALPAKARQANPAVTEAQIEQALAVRPAKFRHVLTRVEPGTLTGLGRLRAFGLKLAIVSNCGRDEIAAWPDSPLASLFDATVFSCIVGLKKPDPAIYRLAAGRLDLEPSRCLFVGDGGGDELAGARAAEMTPVLLTRHIEIMAPHRIAPAVAQADLRVRTVSDLADLLATRYQVDTKRCVTTAGG